MNLNLLRKNMLVAGSHQSGKTHLVKHIINEGNYRALVFSPYAEEWEDQNVFYVETKNHVKDFPFWCNKIMEMANNDKINLAVFDDSDMLFRHHMDTSNALRQMVTGNSHMGSKGLGLMWVTKRPQDIPARIYGVCQILALFSIESPQVKELLNRQYKGLGDLVISIPYGSYKFAYKEIGKAPVVTKV